MIGFELIKLRRSRRPVIALLCLLLFLVLMLLGFYTYAQTETRGRVEFRYTFENPSYFNGLTFSIYAFYFAFLLILPIFAATEAGAQLAGETHARTLHLLLTRPLSRTRIFFTKTFTAAAFLALVLGYFLALTLAVGLLLVGWGDLTLYPGVLQMVQERQSLGQGEALRRFAMVWPASAVALFAPLSLGLWISSWVRNPVNAVGTAVSLYLVLYVISEVHFFRDLRPFLFTSYVSYWRVLFHEEIPWRALLQDGAKLMAFSFLFLALAFRGFRRREEL